LFRLLGGEMDKNSNKELLWQQSETVVRFVKLRKKHVMGGMVRW